MPEKSELSIYHKNDFGKAIPKVAIPFGPTNMGHFKPKLVTNESPSPSPESRSEVKLVSLEPPMFSGFSSTQLFSDLATKGTFFGKTILVGQPPKKKEKGSH